MKGITRRIAAALAIAAAAPAVHAQVRVTTQATLLDRIQIEDMITRYYYELGGGDAKAFGDYYTDDAVLDVNGTVARGKQAIEAIYRGLGDGGGSPAVRGTFHMLLSNPLIEVNGDSATARFLWTGIINDEVHAPPRFVEQGREYDTLVKRNGAWRISRRVVIADSGLPAMFEKAYTPRRDYDPAKDR